jgi:hypothetical protein
MSDDRGLPAPLRRIASKRCISGLPEAGQAFSRPLDEAGARKI